MSIDRLNAKNGFSVGIPAIPIVDSSGNATLGQGLFSGAVSSASTVTGTQVVSTVSTGTAPLAVTSTTVVPNLNADLVDGRHVNDAGSSTNDLWTAAKVITYANSVSGAGGTVQSVTAGNGLTQSGTATLNPTIDVVSHAGTSGSVGTLVVGADSVGVSLGTGGTQAAAGNDSRFDRTLNFNGDVSGSGASSSTITLTVADDSHNHTVANGNFTILGNLTVSGSTITLATQNAVLYDPILTLGGSGTPAFDDQKDRGIEFKYHNGSTAKTGFFGYDDSTGYFTFIPDATNSAEVFSGTMGDIQAGNFRGNLIGNASFATQATSAYQSDLAFRATFSSQSASAYHADIADRTTYASQAASAYNADKANTATTANTATFASQAASAGTANRATFANQAASAYNADFANYASNAGFANSSTLASQSVSAYKSDLATTAQNATYSSFSASAYEADVSAWSNFAASATFASQAASAGSADFSKRGTFASQAASAYQADRAFLASQSVSAFHTDNADRATFASQAASAYQSDRATTANTATFASQAASAYFAERLDIITDVSATVQYPAFVTNSGIQDTRINTGLTFVPSTGVFTANTFTGAVSATTIRATGQITSNVAAGTAPFVITSPTVVPNLFATSSLSADKSNLSQIVDSSAGTTVYPTWVTGTSGYLGTQVTSTKLSFNPTTGVLTATGFSGPLTGTASLATSLNGGATGSIVYQSGANTTAFLAANGTATPAFLQSVNGTAPTLTSSTGTGNVVLASNASLVTPSMTSPTIDTHTVISSYTLTTTSVVPNQILATAATGTYRCVEFIVQGTDATNSKYHVTKILALHNGLTAMHTEYGTLIIGSSTASFDVDFNNNSIRLLVTPTSTSSTVFKVSAILTKV